WPFIDGWKEYLEIPSVTQIGYLAKLFASIRWFQLVPDQTHRVVTAGYGTSAPDAKVKSSTYVTTAATRDGRLAVSYLPAGGTITVDMGRFARRVKARWYDPTNGTFRPASGTPFRNAGKARLRAPAKNADGARDWVLVLTA